MRRQDDAEAAPAAPGAARPGGIVKKKTAALPVSEFLDKCGTGMRQRYKIESTIYCGGARGVV